MNDPRRGARQTAYRILAATRADALDPDKADLWDTGRVESDQSNQVAYAGRPLETGTRVFWSVCIWDHDGQPSPWSEPAWWEMGLFRKFNWEPIWKAQWIGLPRPADADSGPCPHLRRVFHLVRPLKRARAYASALGLYRLFVNGTRVGQDCFTPGFTDYHRRVP
ncbi:MAG TPA: alpha-L-rhamnosidase N-terminal domain-containing protein, partial [Planctomycetota bacterium]|nr:alpha-L-rhamnosidase N-terminal domain-containing protein [Planctomycetota bacterium]